LLAGRACAVDQDAFALLAQRPAVERLKKQRAEAEPAARQRQHEDQGVKHRERARDALHPERHQDHCERDRHEAAANRELADRFPAGEADQRPIGSGHQRDRQPDWNCDREENEHRPIEQVPFAKAQPEGEDRRRATRQDIDQCDQRRSRAAGQLGRASNDLKYAVHSPQCPSQLRRRPRPRRDCDASATMTLAKSIGSGCVAMSRIRSGADVLGSFQSDVVDQGVRGTRPQAPKGEQDQAASGWNIEVERARLPALTRQKGLRTAAKQAA